MKVMTDLIGDNHEWTIQRFYWLYNIEARWACFKCEMPWLCSPKNGYCIDCVAQKILAMIESR